MDERNGLMDKAATHWNKKHPHPAFGRVRVFFSLDSAPGALRATLSEEGPVLGGSPVTDLSNAPRRHSEQSRNLSERER